VPRFRVTCETCDREIPPDRAVRRCPSCAGKLTFAYALDGVVWPPTGGGMWAYRQLLPLVDPANEISLGEGDTPLLRAHGDWGCRLYWKNEGLNPTGSQKARALALAISRAREVKALRVVIASTGSAAVAAAAYCARAGLPCLVLVPRGTPRERLAPITLLGARVVEFQGTFLQIEALLDTLEHDPGWYDATTRRVANPFQAEAPKTIAYEIVAQLGRVPDWVVVPVGGGATLFGIWRGFQDLLRAGRITRVPRLAGVQPTQFNTLERALAQGLRTAAELELIAMDETVDTVLRNLKHGIPPDAPDALRALRDSGGIAVSVTDEAACLAQARIGREEGIVCEPSAAASASAVEALTRAGRLARSDTVVCLLTGSGFRETGGLPPAAPVPLAPDAEPAALDQLVPLERARPERHTRDRADLGRSALPPANRTIT
jgi:threonine synthase